ncbi:MAG TPA: aminotransferase class IV, partial [Bryobacteraceae bacterium]
FIAKGSDVWTPPLSSGCLPGVTRELLLSPEVKIRGFKVHERTFTLEELFQADEVFITSSTRDLLAVREIDGRAVHHQGNAMESLKTAFRIYLASYVRDHAAEGATVS